MNKPTHDELIDAIYGCALDPENWDQTLTRIRQYLDASAINVIGLEVATYDNPFLYSSNISQDQGHLYQEYWFGQDPWVRAAARKGLGAGGVTYCGDMLLDRAELVKTPFYNDWLAGQDIQDVMAANLWGQGPQWGCDPEHPRIVLCFFRGRESECFSEADRQKLEGLSRHLNRAFQIAIRMGVLARNSQLSEAALEPLRHAVIVLDVQAAILAANPAGSRWLGHTPALLQVHNDRLTGFAGELSPSLDEALAQGKNGRASVLNWRPPTPEGSPALLTLRLAPMNETVIRGFSGRRPAFLLIIEAGTQIDDTAFQSFCDLLRLSRAERKVLRQLMQGGTAADIARRLHLAEPTVRTHIQRLRDKSAVSRISELVVMAIAATRTA